jgi:hypothetical protein
MATFPASHVITTIILLDVGLALWTCFRRLLNGFCRSLLLLFSFLGPISAVIVLLASLARVPFDVVMDALH